MRHRQRSMEQQNESSCKQKGRAQKTRHNVSRKMAILLVMPVLLSSVQACGMGSTAVIKKDESVVLSVLAGQSTSDAGVEEMFDAALAKSCPDIKLEWECVDWGEEFDEELRTRFAAGDVPDIIIGKGQDIASYQSTGNLAVIDKPLVQGIQEQSLDLVTVDGDVYGIPYNAAFQGVIYNKNIFEHYNLTPPSTMEELEQIVETFSNQGITSFASHFLEDWSIANMTMQYMVNGVFSADTDWGAHFRERNVNFSDNSDIADYYGYNQWIAEHSWKDCLQIDQYEADKRFEQGEAAMYLTGTWSMQFVDGATDTFGIFPFPNKTGDAKLIRETNMTFMKGAGTRYGEQVDEVLAAILDDEELMSEVLEFTQTASVLESGKPDGPICLSKDIQQFVANGQITEAGIGNTQLIWTFQNEIAGEQKAWLEGSRSLEEVLEYADDKRGDSGV